MFWEFISDLYASAHGGIILQDLPSQTGVYLSADLLIRIAINVPSVHSIKLESLPTVNQLILLQASLEFHPSGCTLLTGLGALYAGFDRLGATTCWKSHRHPHVPS
jgi:dihydrodipicolinate synthase/N-acetylneuraminate lyase